MTELCSWLAAHSSSCLELVAVVFGIVGVALSIPENIWNWPIGMINVALYSVLFVRQGLYANAGLQVVYFGLSVYGWYEWLHGGTNKTELPVARSSRVTLVRSAFATLVIWGLLIVATKQFPHASMTLFDTGTTAVSLVAEWMLARKLIENWVAWTVIDAVYVAMFVVDGLYLTAVNYAIYFVLAVAGFVAWRRVLHARPVTA